MADDLIDPQRPVWNEKWCSPKDSVGPSEGSENQFWVTGVFEPLPPPSLPHHHSRPLHLADYEVQSQSKTRHFIPDSPSSATGHGHQRMEYADILPTSFRRKAVSPLRERHPRSLPISQMGRISECGRISMPRSTGTSLSRFPARGGRRLRIRDEASISSGEWSQFNASSSSSMNRGYDIKDPLLSPHMQPMAPYPTHSNAGIANSPINPGGSFLSSKVTSQRMRSSSMLLQSTRSKAQSRALKTPSRQAVHVHESEQAGSSLNMEYALFKDFEDHGSSSWQADRLSRQIGQSHTTIRPAQPLPSPPTYDIMAGPVDVQDSVSAFGQYLQPSHQRSDALSSSRQASLFNLSSDLYDDFQMAQQPIDFPHTLPNIEWVLQSPFPDSIEDENGIFHCIKQRDSC